MDLGALLVAPLVCGLLAAAIRLPPMVGFLAAVACARWAGTWRVKRPSIFESRAEDAVDGRETPVMNSNQFARKCKWRQTGLFERRTGQLRCVCVSRVRSPHVSGSDHLMSSHEQIRKLN